ncbi:hypothetical protein [Comamonas thiooxydans]|uniref:hypothetical protein n=1 Tax=Comamonas thiooxydans TaxID=363952 RepID=UPI0015A73BC4|nr:hypothetical protein [Comamonas thiooxydans]QOQ83805.1 hypothetical protein INP81_08180 [Comamonas thiooxydans]
MSVNNPDPLQQVMDTVVAGFAHTTAAIREVRDRQQVLETQLQDQARAAYSGMTASGRARFVSTMVDQERAANPYGAQARVAARLDLTPGRVSQLVNSARNRENGR